MRKVIPTVFAKTKNEFDDRFNKLKKISRDIQIDIMDGKFVSNKSIGLDKLPDMKHINAEAHLMVNDPENYFEILKKKHIKKVLFHYESFNDLSTVKRIFSEARKLQLTVFLVFNPETSFRTIISVIENIGSLKGIMLMGVTPGKENQELNKTVLRKIKNIKRDKKITIQVDGGVNDETALILKNAGADIINTGSYVSRSKNPEESLKKLESLFLR